MHDDHYDDMRRIRSENARLKMETSMMRRALAELTALRDVGLAVNSRLELHGIVDATLTAVTPHLGVDRALMLLLHEPSATLTDGRIRGATKEIEARVTSLRIPMADTSHVFVELMTRGVPLLVTRENRPDAIALLDLLGCNELLGVPLVARGRALGVLVVDNATSGRLVPDMLMDLLSAVGNQVAVAVDNARLYREIEHHSRTLEQRVEERTRALARATDEAEAARRAAEAANAAKSTFLANMSHELRTPLNAIIGYSEMLQDEAPEADPVEVIADLRKIHAAGRHLLGLINDILDISKIEAGRMELFVEEFDPAPLIDEVHNTIRPLAEQRGNTVVVTIDAGLGRMRADLTKTRQVLLNLMSNACKFTEKGRVTLTARRQHFAGGDRLVFTVTDTGIGMGEKQLGRLFQSFAQADASTTRKYGGTGLGLAISRHLCRLMGGDITVDSAPGKGSTFMVSLPAQVQEPRNLSSLPAPAEQPHVRAPVPPGARRVLVVDDDPQVFELMQRYLGKEGFHVELAANGQDALRLARELKPHAITLDVMMTGMDGWMVLAALKGDPELRHIPVIMLTMVDQKNRGYALGAADYLTKPMDRESLLAALRRHVEVPGHALVVDDDTESRDMIARALEAESFLVSRAGDGAEGIDRVKERLPGVILLDLVMPRMDGFEFIEELRTLPYGRGVPVIVVTAKDLTADERARLNGSVARVIAKGSVGRDELLAEVRALVERHSTGVSRRA